MSTTEVQNQKHIDSTIETIEEHVKSAKLSGIPNAIGSWVKTLKEHKEFKGIASELEKLQDAVSEKNHEKIVQLMSSVGEATTKAAEKAQGDVSKNLKSLGKALSTGAKAIGKMEKEK